MIRPSVLLIALVSACMPLDQSDQLETGSTARGALNSTGVQYVEFTVSEPTTWSSICASHSAPTLIGLTASDETTAYILYLQKIDAGTCITPEDLASEHASFLPGLTYSITAATDDIVDFTIWSVHSELIVWTPSRLACMQDRAAAIDSCIERGTSIWVVQILSNGFRITCTWHDEGGAPIWYETWDSCNDIVYAPTYAGPLIYGVPDPSCDQI